MAKVQIALTQVRAIVVSPAGARQATWLLARVRDLGIETVAGFCHCVVVRARVAAQVKDLRRVLQMSLSTDDCSALRAVPSRTHDVGREFQLCCHSFTLSVRLRQSRSSCPMATPTAGRGANRPASLSGGGDFLARELSDCAPLFHSPHFAREPGTAIKSDTRTKPITQRVQT